ncbi:tetratricopeptide repeat protein [Micromonospora sp. WMMD1120]|uniref:tetratricopeptide repeat protein n=1 Tax=Micromonospora sp. WMMD1120 TaxID=3016106 RepID=UPI00068F1E1C|nr:tetratricopeptide repeat protein [Micromonospora sp. WMMD1120]MDG4807704.1 tetratricopeptide repeat protein [Micromonospora sp. WMMD1120]
MAFPRKYSHDFIDAAVRQVAALRDSGHRGPISAVARELNLDRRLVQEWVSKTRTPRTPSPPPAPMPPPVGDPAPVLLPPDLMLCRICDQPMTRAPDGNRLVYQCPGNCRRHGLDATLVADIVGEAILRHTPAIVTAPGHPKSTNLAAAHAGRVIARVTAGTTATDLRLTWRTALAPTPGLPGPALTERLRSARALTAADPVRARETLRDALAGVDPATTTADPTLADATHLYAELLIRLGNPAAAIRWATYAHRSHTQLRGPSARPTLAAVHTLATAHRGSGHHQRAYHVYRHLAEQLTATTGPDAQPTLATQASIALVLRDLGHCAAARRLLADTITAHRRTHPHHPATARMLHHLHQMWEHCAERGHDHPDIEVHTEPAAATQSHEGGPLAVDGGWRTTAGGRDLRP